MKKHKKVTRCTRAIKHRRKIIKVVHKHCNPASVPVVTISETPIKLPRKRRTSNVSRMYFTQETEDAIVLYNNTEDTETREGIFNSKIIYPFQKLVENVFNTFKFSYFETGPQDVQKECLTHLVANMHKYDPTRCSKSDPKKKTRAFAYFSIIAKHYLILLNNTNYKKFNQNVEISEERDENTVQLQQEDKYYARRELTDFIQLIIDFWEKNVNKIFTKQRDLNIANAVIEIIRRGENISLFNKKALYLYIREIADCRTQQITKVINKMKPVYNKIRQSYVVEGKLPTEISDSVSIKQSMINSEVKFINTLMEFGVPIT
jgi:hypothetical protein